MGFQASTVCPWLIFIHSSWSMSSSLTNHQFLNHHWSIIITVSKTQVFTTSYKPGDSIRDPFISSWRSLFTFPKGSLFHPPQKVTSRIAGKSIFTFVFFSKKKCSNFDPLGSHKGRAPIWFFCTNLLGDSAAAWAAVVLICNSAPTSPTSDTARRSRNPGPQIGARHGIYLPMNGWIFGIRF